jgi:RNA recognition motif-containing protein
MVKKIYVGNLPFSASEDDIRELFEAHGEVHSVSVVTDRETGRSRGFGFVEMDGPAADAAIAALDQQAMSGRNLRVSDARPRTDRGGGGGRDRGDRGERSGGGGRDRRW